MRGKLAVAGMIVLLLVGIAVLGESGALGLLFLVLALGIAIFLVRRA